MKLFHTKSLLAGDIPKSLTSEDNSARILTNLTDDRFKAHWRELIRGNDLRGFPLGKIIGKENKLFSLGPVVKFYFDQQMKHKPKMILQELFLFFLIVIAKPIKLSLRIESNKRNNTQITTTVRV